MGKNSGKAWYERKLQKQKDKYHNNAEYREDMKSRSKKWYQDNKEDINFKMQRSARKKERYHNKKLNKNGKESQVDSRENTGV